jgi:pimeloyl-ACP methyl ester carboxylesterase
MRRKALFERLGRFPSFVVGGVRQVRASVEPRRKFEIDPSREIVVLVPGAFCSSAVMNRLGGKLDLAGFNVLVPEDFPYWWGPVANLCPLEEAARQLLQDLLRAAERLAIRRLWLAGHSNGGLIGMLAAEMAEGEGHPELAAMLAGIITMATPFRGADIAPLLKSMVPVCRDIAPGAVILDRIRQGRDRVALAMQAGRDFLVPPNGEVPAGVRRVTMDGFQHMDFLVGSEEQLDRTANMIAEVVRGSVH